MLFINLEKSQELRIGEDIRIKFLTKLGESNVRIGIDAPRCLKIVRAEVPQNYPHSSEEN